jgi:hypothetical protein
MRGRERWKMRKQDVAIPLLRNGNADNIDTQFLYNGDCLPVRQTGLPARHTGFATLPPVGGQAQ